MTSHPFQSQENPYSSLMYVDTHVHIYPHFSLKKIIDCAQANIPDASAPCILMLTERQDDDAFTRILTGDLHEPGYNITPLSDGCSIKIDPPSGVPAYVVAGRQIATEERLEVLALGTRSRFEDGHSIRTSIQDVISENALPVIPWALGKWWGKRGELLRGLLEQKTPGTFLLADSAMRPSLTPPSPLFKISKEKDMPLLAGTDPLPRDGQESVVAMFGIRLNQSPSEDNFTRDLLTQIQQGTFTTFGRRRNLIQVLKTTVG